MIIRNPDDFIGQLEQGDYPAEASASASAVMMIEPAEFSVCVESAVDNPYMDLATVADPDRALRQSRNLGQTISRLGYEVVSFPGDPQTTDGIFPNNVFATTRENFIIGHMLHPGRQKEAERSDIRSHFRSQGYTTIDLSQQDCIAELTGPLVIDHARRIGFCGMTRRVDEAGLQAMYSAFNLKMIFCFQLQPAEYHTNVVMMILAGRACVICPDAFLDSAVPLAIAAAFPERTLILSEAEKNAFAGNCIALGQNDLFMSETAVDILKADKLKRLKAWGFTLHSSPLDEIEKAGGSLRCMLAEIF